MIVRWSSLAAGLALVGLSAVSAGATQITFTGGVVTLSNATTTTTNNVVLHSSVDHYVEDGFKLDFIGDAEFIGNYYGAGNDVIHGHWASGGLGTLTAVEITKVGGGTFDLNYFILTSNTATGGGAANGTEQTFIEGFVGGVSTGAAMLLPPENWGFPATQIFLGPAFDGVDMVKFFATNDVDCFGMDEFFIDEEAPSAVPEPASLLLLATGLSSMGLYRRRKKS